MKASEYATLAARANEISAAINLQDSPCVEALRLAQYHLRVASTQLHRVA